MSRIGRAFALIGGLLVAWIVLRIFVPAGYVNLILGTLLVIGTVGLAVKSLNFPPRVAWWLTAGALALVFVNLAIFPFLNHKFGWVAQSLEERTLWSSFRASDITNPKKNLQLHMALYTTERAEIKSRESVLTETLEELQRKLSRGQLLSDEERTVLQNVREQLEKLDEEREKVLLSLRVSPNSTLRMVRGSGDTFDVTLDTDWTQVDLKRDHRVPDGTEINFYPRVGETLYLRSRDIVYRRVGRIGQWEKQDDKFWVSVTRIPTLAPDPVYFRVDRPANAGPDWQPTMTVKLF